MASRVQAVTKERTSDPALKELLIAGADRWWGNKFNVTMRLDTDGAAYPRGMRYKDAPTSWRQTPKA